MGTQFNEMVDGVVINNHVIKNSCRGSMFTDDGPFSAPSAAALGKDHGLCTMHARQAIPGATAGLGNTSKAAIQDLNALIFKHTSVKVLEEKFEECCSKYGRSSAALKFLDSLHENREKLCRAFTQAIFSFNHTTTQRGEGWNDKFKGHGSLKHILSGASLPELIDRADAVVVDTSNKSLKCLVKVRENEERVSPSYKAEATKSLELSAISVKSCEKVDGSESKYIITRTNGKDRFIVDLKTRIMHRGEIFEIPTCGCGYWQSCFRLCRDIVKALVFSSNNQHSVKLGDLLVPTNIHPYHLVQLHPLWPQALTKANRADYCDLDQINRILRGGTTKASASGTTEPVATTCGACPDKFYTFGDNVPKTHKVCHTKLGEAFKIISDLAINKGNEATFKHCHARLLQFRKEIKDMIESSTDGVLTMIDQIPLPPAERASNKAVYRKADSVNNSRLSATADSSNSSRRRKPKKKQYLSQQLHCSQCELLAKHANFNVTYNDHSIEQCLRADLFQKYILKSEAGGKSEDGSQQEAV